MIFIAFSGTFSAIGASFLPGGTRRDGLVLVADLAGHRGLAYSVWGLAYLRRSFSIIPEARRLVTGGPYRLSRHPVYLGEIATAIGVNLATAGWLSVARDHLLHRLRAAAHPLGRAHPGAHVPERLPGLCKTRPPLPTQPVRSRLTGCAWPSG